MNNAKSNSNIYKCKFTTRPLISLMIISIILFTTFFSDTSDASEFNDTPHIELIDIDGNIIVDPLINNSTIYFDTITHSDGTTTYSAKSNVEIDSIPASLSITSPNGLFHISVKADGLTGTWMDDYILIVKAGDQFESVLAKDNEYESAFNHGFSKAKFLPNTDYDISFEVIGESSSAPEGNLENITFTFTLTTSNETHIVCYMVDDVIYNVNVMMDGQTFNNMPNPTKSNNQFVGWMDQNGKMIEEGDVFDYEGDIILTAEWKPMMTFPKILSILTIAGLSCTLMIPYLRGGSKGEN